MQRPPFTLPQGKPVTIQRCGDLVATAPFQPELFFCLNWVTGTGGGLVRRFATKVYPSAAPSLDAALTFDCSKCVRGAVPCPYN